ncbi:MAG: ABC transporter substrate-binding protein [Woeseia sp.]|nr:ABC transporter substrate-binding protein [Woeseia sp.]
MILLLTACSSSDSEKVTFNMGWLPQGSMAGVIVAIDQGFYTDAGIDVEAVRGFGGIRTVNEIDQGMFEFGYGDPLAVILNRANGGKTKLVGAINDRWPAALCYISSRHNIETPADLAGLKIGGGQTSPMQVIVPEWLELNGVPRDEIQLMQLDPAIVVNSLVEGQIDAGECWKGNSFAIFQKRAAEADMEIGAIEYSKFGLDIYGNGIGTSESFISESPEVVRAFVGATYRGYEWVENNPAAATQIVTDHYPVLDAEITRQQIDEMIDLMNAENGRGGLVAEKVERTLEFLSGAYDIESTIGTDDIYTTDFLQPVGIAGE